MKHSDIPPDSIPQMEANLRIRIAGLMGMPLERVKKIEIYDSGMEGRTGVRFTFEPDLTAEERVKLHSLMNIISQVYGGRKPIYPGEA